MKKNVLLTASAILMTASAVTLTGCSRYGTNLPKAYKPFFDYTFGGDYTVETVEKGISNKKHKEARFGYTDFEVTFTNYYGEKQTDTLSSYTVTKADKKDGVTQRHEDNANVYSFITSIIGDKAADEFADKVFSKYYTVKRVDREDTKWRGDDFNAMIIIYSPLAICWDTTTSPVTDMISADGGLRYIDADLKSTAQNKAFKTLISATVPEGTDEAEAIDTIKAIEADFVEYTEKPMNYSFRLSIRKPTEENDYNTERLYNSEYIMGEEFVREEDGPKPSQVFRQKLCELYGVPYDADDTDAE